MLITPTPVAALTDCDVPFVNVAYRGTLITSGGWSVFFTVWQVTSPGATSGQTLVYGPVVVTLTSAGAGTPTIPAQYLQPSSIYQCRTQAFPMAGLSSPPSDQSFKWTNDIFVATSA